jgi:glucan biosynthesis protein
MESQIKNVFDMTNSNSKEIIKINAFKLDTQVFNTKLEVLEKQLETIRYATYDNFRVQKASDNYIEKYLPFVIQNMIS